MKGFLNKVQRRVSGSGASDAAANDKPSTPPVPAKSASAAPNSNGARSEATPRADVALPRRERRFVSPPSVAPPLTPPQKVFLYPRSEDAGPQGPRSPLRHSNAKA
jgi:hypothetical protein